MYSRISNAVIGLTLLLLLLVPAATFAMPGMSKTADGKVITGTIKETMNASGYTYMLVDSNGAESWVAIPETMVKTGDTVNYFEGMEMKDFTSKTLNRSFGTIFFSPGLASEKNVAAPSTESSDNDSFASAVKAERSEQAPAAINDTQASGGSAGAIVPFTEISVEKAAGPNGYTVSELFAQAKELNGKIVKIRGKVVKVSPAIMGRNWVHLQDGSGNPMQNSHDLVVTTNETVDLDTTVTFEGTITANKDFGAGYKYDAIVEKAVIIP